MMVLMTSERPNRAFKIPGRTDQSPPARNPSSMARIIINGAGRAGAYTPKAVMAMAPIYSCPSAPMFKKPVRKPTDTPRPARMSGVALTKTSLKEYQEPTIPRIKLATERGMLLPTIRIRRKEAARTTTIVNKKDTNVCILAFIGHPLVWNQP